MSRRLLLPALMAATCCAAAGCSSPSAPPSTSGTDPKPPATVVTTIAERQTLVDEIELSAEVHPWAAVTVASETTGAVVELPVEQGDHVDAGAPLALLDATDAGARLAQARAALAAAQAAAVQAGRDLDRGKLLATTRDISDGELDRLQLAQATTSARAEEAEAAVALVAEQLADATIRAPFAGVVSARHVELGTLLTPGAPVCRIVDRQRVKVRAAAAQRDRVRLRTGLPATVVVPALPSARFSGVIRLLGEEADTATGTYEVEAAIPSPDGADGALLPGMRGTMIVQLGRREVLTVPRRAVISSGPAPSVFVVSGDVARQVVPVLGQLTPDVAEIVEGLEAGSVVVVQGQHRLSDGDRVEVLTP